VNERGHIKVGGAVNSVERWLLMANYYL